MIPIYPILALLIIAAVSLLIVRIGSTALMMTGLPRETASFQSLSAFFGVGFTTREAELVVSHPVRRRIVRHLIIAGNLGITSALATFIVLILNPGRAEQAASVVVGPDAVAPVPDAATTPTMTQQIVSSFASATWFETFALGIGSVIAIFLVLNLTPVRKATEWLIRKTLGSTKVIRPVNYDTLLRVMHGYVLSELLVEEGSTLAHKTLVESGLGSMGILVLGISRADGTYIGAPAGRDIIEPGDMLLVYAREDDLATLTSHLGDESHAVEDKPQEHQATTTIDAIADHATRDRTGGTHTP